MLDVFTRQVNKTAQHVIPILTSLPLEIKHTNPELTGHDIHLVTKAIAKVRNLVADMKINLNGYVEKKRQCNSSTAIDISRI